MRRPILGVLFATCVAFGPSCGLAADQAALQSDSAPLPAACERLCRLLDPDVPVDERRAALAAFDKDALGGKHFAQYVVGSLYRVGRASPTGFVEQDTDKAKRYLSTAAAHGQLRGMAKMAEIELAEHHYLEAMVWAQVYGHYTVASNPGQKKTEGSAGYFADLLHRIYEHIDDKKTADTALLVSSFIAAHDVEIRAGMEAVEAEMDSSALHSANTKLHFEPLSSGLLQHRRDCYAEYLVEFSADGSARQAWMLDALPDVQVGKDLRAAAMRVHINPAEAALGSRFALVPLDFSFGNYSLSSRR